MTNELRFVEDYELYLYSLNSLFPAIRDSTLVLIRRGSSLARVEGELRFDHGVRPIVRERLIIKRKPILIDSYGYEVWERQIKHYWYDSQPHPGEPSLQSTHPHHKHVPPNIKHNRVPAPGLSFARPNFPLLVREIENLIAEIQKSL